MEVLVTVLLCVIIFLLYLLNENKNEILRLKRERRERDIDVAQQPQVQTPPLIQPQLPPNSGIFVSVIFKKGDSKSYDYLLGNLDAQVGDFVVVHVNDKIIGERKWRIAQIVYISQPGEVSPMAKSLVIKKADHPKW